MRLRPLGAGDDYVEVFPVGLGAMQLSLRTDLSVRDAVHILHVALDEGVTFIDTADVYAPLDSGDIGHNERLVAAALRTWPGDRSQVVVATKGGMTRSSDGGWHIDARPEHLRSACEASLLALGVERIGLYYLHTVDPLVPFPESVAALAGLRPQVVAGGVGLLHQAGSAGQQDAGPAGEPR